MGTPNNAFQAAIYTRLTTFTALTNLIGTNVFNFVPENAQPPFVVIGDDTAIDWSTKDRNGWDLTVTIHCWDFEKTGNKSVNAIIGAIYDALHRQEANITVAGFNLIMIQSDFETTLRDPTVQGQGDRFYHGIARYRALIQS
jgi:hypothetical protein